MIRAALLAILLAGAAWPAAAQGTAANSGRSTAGNVGSASLRNGYPAAGGAISPPFAAASPATTTPATGTTNPSATSGTESTGRGGSGGGRNSGTAAGGSGLSSATRGGGTNWVVCPPSGSSGLAALFTGTDLSCAPN